MSRVKADMRTIATAMETYAVDNNVYPPDGYDNEPEGTGWWMLNYTLTTPISYMSNGTVEDAFSTKEGIENRVFRYVNFKWTYVDSDPAEGNAAFEAAYAKYSSVFGDYAFYSCGPDGASDFGTENTAGGNFAAPFIYDATNGTVSVGDIIRCQKDPDAPRYEGRKLYD